MRLLKCALHLTTTSIIAFLLKDCSPKNGLEPMRFRIAPLPLSRRAYVFAALPICLIAYISCFFEKETLSM